MIDLEYGRRFVHQWELNQRIQIDGFLPGTWVEFSHKKDHKNSALTTEAYAEGDHVYANIPNILLQLSGYIHVFVDAPASDMAHPAEERYIKVAPREKPSYYIYTETPTVSFKDKANMYWGTENAGKVLVVGDDGYLTTVETTGGSPASGGSTARIGYVELLADKWGGSDNLYSQVVSVDGVTENSQVDLTPDVEQLVIFYEKDLTFVTENEGGVVTVYAIGQKPENDYTIQVTITEVSA